MQLKCVYCGCTFLDDAKEVCHCSTLRYLGCNIHEGISLIVRKDVMWRRGQEQRARCRLMLHALVSQMSMISNRRRRLSSTQLVHKSLSIGFNHVLAPFLWQLSLRHFNTYIFGSFGGCMFASTLFSRCQQGLTKYHHLVICSYAG